MSPRAYCALQCAVPAILIILDRRGGSNCLLFVVLNFSTHGHIPTARSGPSLTAAVSALPLPQPSSPPATMWAPGRPPPSWGPSVQQIGIWAIGPYPSTRKTSSWQHADVGLVWDVREAAPAYPQTTTPGMLVPAL